MSDSKEVHHRLPKEPVISSAEVSESDDEDFELTRWHLDFMSKSILDHALESCRALGEAQNALEELKTPSLFATTIERITYHGDKLADIVNKHKEAQNWFPEEIGRQIRFLSNLSDFVEAHRKKLAEAPKK